MTFARISVYSSLLAALLAISLSAASTSVAPPHAVPEGFASLDGGTTGGNPANVCVANVVTGNVEATGRSIDDALACTQKDPHGGVVTFAPANAIVEGVKSLHLPSNVTLAGPVTLQDVSIRVFGQHNIIIRDISFTSKKTHTNRAGNPCPDPTDPSAHGGGPTGTSGCAKDILVGGSKDDVADPRDSHNIWIEHDSFDHCGDKCIVLTTGAQTKEGRYTGTDNVTVSDNVFQNSYLATLFSYQGSALRPQVGFSTQKCEDIRDHGKDGKFILPRERITVYGNLFINVRQRNVRAAYCTLQVHEFNNVIEDLAHDRKLTLEDGKCRGPGFPGKGPESTHGAQILFENNVVSAWREAPPVIGGTICTNDIVQTGPAEPHDGIDKPGYIRLSGNILRNGAIAHDNHPEKVFTSLPYRYTLLPADKVLDAVTRAAGPDKP